MSKFQVYYRYGFSGESAEYKTQKPGKEFPLNIDFDWNGERWKALSLYLCEEGMVLDLCKFMDMNLLQAYFDKWGTFNHYSDLTPAQRIENDEDAEIFKDDFQLSIEINGSTFSSDSGCSTMFNPLCTEFYGSEEKQLSAHYELGEEQPWTIWRRMFQERPDVIPEDQGNGSIKVILTPDKSEVFGMPFTIHEPGEEITIINPVTKQEHILQIKEMEWQKIDFVRKGSPDNALVISYTLTPDLSEEDFSLVDRGGGDGENQPGVCFYRETTDETGEKLHTSCSYLYFEPKDTIQWRPTFMEILKEEIEL